MPKVVIALVAGYAIGGGHVLHVVCDLTIAADNAVFGQVGPSMGSFDGGLGVELPRPQRRPEEGPRDLVPLPPIQRPAGPGDGAGERGRAGGLSGGRRGRLGERGPGQSPLAIRLLKSAFNAELDGQVGIQELAGNATLLYYMSDEAREFHAAQREKRRPDARRFPWLP